MRDTTNSSITIHIAGEANQAVLLPNAATVHNEQTAKSKQNNDFLIVLLYRQLSVYRQYVVSCQSSVYRQQSLIRDANSEHALTDLRLFLYVKERPEVTILSWGKGRKDLTYAPKNCRSSLLLRCKFLDPLQFSRPVTIFSTSNLIRLRPHIKILSTLLKKKERTSPIWETSSLLYFDSFCSNEIIQRLELQLLQLLRQEPQFQQQPS